MQYVLAFRYILDRRSGFMNLLLLTVQFIPVVGPIVMLGYQAEVMVDLNHDRNLRRHALFKFDYFVEYLTRGVWPFLIQLVLCVFYVPVGILWFVMIAGNMAANAPPNPQALALVLGLYIIVTILIAALSTPMTFHAEFTGRFDLGGGLRFAMSFWTKVGGLAIVTGIVYVILSVFVMILGLLVCCIGIYPAAVVLQMAHAHLMVQLYREYLDRGGESLDEKIDREDDDDYNFHADDPRPRRDDDRGHRIDRFDDDPDEDRRDEH